jgi:Rhodopirellula transposase DDE domain
MTDAIFEQLDFATEEAQQDSTVLRLSLDAKAVVKIGAFSRGGKSRADTQGCDHDFHPKATVTPYGIFLPQLDEVFLYLATSKVTRVTQIYQTGVTSTQKAMAQVETQIQRLTNSKLEGLPNLGKWFVDITDRAE